MQRIAVTLVYSTKPREVIEVALQLEPGCTVGQALQASGVLAQFPNYALPSFGHGLWGKKVTPSHVLQDQDRLELYRPLTVDPKIARRERFVGQGAKKAAGLFAKRRVGAKAGY
ncbi:MAG: RnfH family protein [Pseudomonadota bacterium]